MKSKFLAMLLAMVMCLGMLSPAVLATEGIFDDWAILPWLMMVL